MAQPYQLIANSDGVLRIEDNAHIPNDGGNRDWQEYQAWLAEGNTPDPAPPLPEIVPVPDPNMRLDTGVTQAVDTYNSVTIPVDEADPLATTDVKQDARLLRLEETVKALCEGHMVDTGKSAGF